MFIQQLLLVWISNVILPLVVCCSSRAERTYSSLDEGKARRTLFSVSYTRHQLFLLRQKSSLNRLKRKKRQYLLSFFSLFPSERLLVLNWGIIIKIRLLKGFAYDFVYITYLPIFNWVDAYQDIEKPKFQSLTPGKLFVLKKLLFQI